MPKKITKPYVEFVGHNSIEVTGSANLVRFLDYTILVDYGLRQTSNIEDDYKVNSKRHKDIKPKNLNAIIVTHSHIDHTGLIPSLFKDGASCPIYVPNNCKGLLTYLWQDTVKIFSKDFERFGRKPIYTQEDVEKALSHIIECDIHEKVYINNNISFIYYNAKHICRARQVYMEFNDGNITKKLGFTGDISNKTESFYLNDFEPLPYVNLLIGECTYSNNKRLNKTKDRDKDCQKIDYAIQNALKNKGKILIPTFSMDRLENILTTIYKMYNGKLPIKVLIDSPLGKSISEIWEYVIDKNEDLWLKIKRCEDIRWNSEFKDTVAFSKLEEPMLIIAGGGFLTGGRATYWTQQLLGNSKNRIVFCGYSSPESPSGMIKSGKCKEINIDGKIVPIHAPVTILNSFSSHMDYQELMDYYTQSDYNKIALVHSNFEDKIGFAKELEKKLSKVNKTSRVISVNQDTKINF